jgi:2Fe-2S ferredoxin
VNVKVVFVRWDGARDAVDVPEGTSVMQAAISNDIDGIVAECGGSVMCATCHVYVEGSTAVPLPPVLPDEDEMLNITAAPRLPSSRLSCQLIVEPGAGELVVRLPEAQL